VRQNMSNLEVDMRVKMITIDQEAEKMNEFMHILTDKLTDINSAIRSLSGSLPAEEARISNMFQLFSASDSYYDTISKRISHLAAQETTDHSSADHAQLVWLEHKLADIDQDISFMQTHIPEPKHSKKELQTEMGRVDQLTQAKEKVELEFEKSKDRLSILKQIEALREEERRIKELLQALRREQLECGSKVSSLCAKYLKVEVQKRQIDEEISCLTQMTNTEFIEFTPLEEDENKQYDDMRDTYSSRIVSIGNETEKDLKGMQLKIDHVKEKKKEIRELIESNRADFKQYEQQNLELSKLAETLKHRLDKADKKFDTLNEKSDASSFESESAVEDDSAQSLATEQLKMERILEARINRLGEMNHRLVLQIREREKANPRMRREKDRLRDRADAMSKDRIDNSLVLNDLERMKKLEELRKLNKKLEREVRVKAKKVKEKRQELITKAAVAKSGIQVARQKWSGTDPEENFVVFAEMVQKESERWRTVKGDVSIGYSLKKWERILGMSTPSFS
jgi:chromosome segregation ATPase